MALGILYTFIFWDYMCTKKSFYTTASVIDFIEETGEGIVYIYMSHSIPHSIPWLVVEQTPLKNMSSSVGITISNWMEK